MQGAKSVVPTPADVRAITKEATIYGFPLVDNYRVRYSYFVDRSGPEFKAPWNTLVNNARVYTPDDKSIQTPNSDTPYSYVGADLRAEPLVFTSALAIEKGRYYSLQFIDQYTFNFAYVGSRATGNGVGRYLLAGPNWKGQKPRGIKAVGSAPRPITLRALSHPVVQSGRYRQRQEGPSWLQGRTAIEISRHAQPAAAPAIDFIKPLTPEQERSSLEFFNVLNFILQFAPTNPSEKALMARFARIGVGAGKTIDIGALSPGDAPGDAGRHGRRLESVRRIQGERTRHRQADKRRRLWHARIPEKRLYGANVRARRSASMANLKAEALYPVYFVDATKSVDRRQSLHAALRTRSTAAGQCVLVVDHVRTAAEPSLCQSHPSLPNQFADAAGSQARRGRRYHDLCAE